MVGQVIRLALCLATISILVAPATSLALPIRFRVQQVESSFVLRDAPNGISDRAGESAFNGLISLADGSLGGGMAGVGGAVGSMGSAYGGGTGAQSGGTRVQTRSMPRAWSSNSRGVWNRDYSGAGFFDSNALVPLMVTPLPASQPTALGVEKVPEPATVLMGAAAAFLLFRRRRRNHT